MARNCTCCCKEINVAVFKAVVDGYGRATEVCSSECYKKFLADHPDQSPVIENEPKIVGDSDISTGSKTAENVSKNDTGTSVKKTNISTGANTALTNMSIKNKVFGGIKVKTPNFKNND